MMARQIDPIEIKTYRVIRSDGDLVVTIGPKHELTNKRPVIVLHSNYQWVGQRTDEEIHSYYGIDIMRKPIELPHTCTAKNCNDNAVGDYNGHGDWACQRHIDKWEREFDENYR